MSLIIKSGVAVATILAACCGLASLTQAASLSGTMAAAPAVQMPERPSAVEALPVKAHYYHRYYHRGYHHGHYYHRRYHHRRYY
jgi:hypothetical protein